MIMKTTFAHVLSVLWKTPTFLAGRSELILTMQSNSNHVKTIIYTVLILSSSKGIELTYVGGFRIDDIQTATTIYLRTKDMTHLEVRRKGCSG